MRRAGTVAARTTAVLAVAMSLAVLFAVPAAGGAGCHRGWQFGQTEGRGTTIEMRENCFGPTVLRVEPGAEITFVNRDLQVHRVDGVGWSSEKTLAQGEYITHRFSNPGTYPFTCMLHLGMSGAIVVGDGLGSGPVTNIEPVQLAATGGSSQQPSDASEHQPPVPAILVLGVAAAAGAFSLGLTRGRRETAARPRPAAAD
jgi:plastocyanin